MTFRPACFASLLVVAATACSAFATPVVTSFTPTSGPEGTKIVVTGSGFTGTSSIFFAPMGDPAPVSFSVVDDSTLEVTAPQYTQSGLLQYGFGLMVQAGTTATLAIADLESITTDVTYEGGEHHFHVLSGGKLSGGGGSVVTYVEAGGTYDFTGGGGNYIFVENGGTLNFSLGGQNRVFAEPNAILSGALIPPGLPVPPNLFPLTDLTLSLVSSNYHYPVPEPSTWLLAMLAGLGLVAGRAKSLRRRRSTG